MTTGLSIRSGASLNCDICVVHRPITRQCQGQHGSNVDTLNSGRAINAAPGPHRGRAGAAPGPQRL